jgi:glycosyltransferase involved in cell wall biosynthesis
MIDAKEVATHGFRAAILYHFMHPDDVVSAVHFDGLAQDLAAKGWQVEAFPCNRGCRDETQVYGPFEEYQSVIYRRIWRPRFSQKSFLGRLANSVWMILAWSRLAFRQKHTRPDVVVVGTDPVFAVATVIILKMLAPRIKIAHWCFDMHPEASIVDGDLLETSLLVKMAKFVLKRAYRSCDLIADLGLCMRERLRLYDHTALECELTPWALVEPDKPIAQDRDTRRELFGTAKIGILYSGNFGEAHELENMLAFARELRKNESVHFCFAVRGKRAEDLKKAVTEADTHISFAGFAPIEQLEKRLGSADIHLVSLKSEWSGVAVPSKFFGSIASGRPVLYSGPRGSAIGSWIEQHQIGWIIDPDNIPDIAKQITNLAENPSGLANLQTHCMFIYKAFFSRKEVTDAWDTHLKSLLVT